jgi:hypothetical protein
VGPRAGLDAVESEKSLSFAGNRTPAVQSVAIVTELSRFLFISVELITYRQRFSARNG